MNALAIDARTLCGDVSPGICFHCGEPLAGSTLTAQAAGREQPVCCMGCAAAANWIEDSGLDDYYRLRSREGNRVDADANDYRVWDREDIQREHVSTGVDASEITVVVEGLRCAACAWLIDRALHREAGVVDASVNAVTGRLRLRWDPARTRLSTPLARIAALGFRPHLAGDAALEQARRRERNALLLRLGLALLAATQAMMFSEALYLDSGHQMSLATRDVFRWLTFLVCTPVVFYSGQPFFLGLWREWRQRRLGMDTLAGASIALAYGASVVEMLRGGPQVWFDAAAMFVLFLLAARALEQFARRRAQAQLDLLARAQPALCWRWQDERWQQVPTAALQLGDTVSVASGSAVPADGELLDAAAWFDQSLLTGEAAPCEKHAGDPVYAGCIATRTRVRIRVGAVGAQTRLSQIQRLVQQAQAQRPALATLADRYAGHFVRAMLLVAVSAAVYHWPQDPGRAFAIGLAVLVAACPCALSLAVPAALSAANDALARRGVLVLGEQALERLANIDTVLFDKTGTLSEGRPRIQALETFGDTTPAQARSIAAALERGGTHPLAAAFIDEDAALSMDAVRVEAGRGAEGRCNGHVYRFGRADYAVGGDDDGAVWLGSDGIALARFTIGDRLRACAHETVTQLSALGLDVQLASGDGESAVDAAADELGITIRYSRQTPEDKLRRVRDLQAQGRRVLMVGDGSNDAPVLAGADVSMAMGRGSALAQRAGDLLLLGEHLGGVADAIVLARRTRQVLRQNLVWAVAYNSVAVAIAASGWIHPGFAALGMAGSSLAVTLNSLRFNRGQVAS